MEMRGLQALEYINTRLNNIEQMMKDLVDKVDFSLAIQRNHLIRVKNGDYIDDNSLLMGRPYNDLKPNQAYEIYQNPDLDFIILDVSAADYSGPTLPNSVRLPLEEIPQRYPEIQSKVTPILIVSESGLRSILACEQLIKRGYFNLNNISGGHQHWPGHKKSELSAES